jgi:hypothetical protein
MVESQQPDHINVGGEAPFNAQAFFEVLPSNRERAMSMLRAQVPDNGPQTPRAVTFLESGEWDSSTLISIMYIPPKPCIGRVGTITVKEKVCISVDYVWVTVLHGHAFHTCGVRFVRGGSCREEQGLERATIILHHCQVQNSGGGASHLPLPKFFVTRTIPLLSLLNNGNSLLRYGLLDLSLCHLLEESSCLKPSLSQVGLCQTSLFQWIRILF